MNFLNIPAAFGIAGASGLNATLPLLTMSLLARMHVIRLDSPFDALQSDIAFYGLVVLGVLEFLADKIPVVDSIGHVVMLPVSAVSGAVLFASQSGTVHDLHPGVLVILSLLAGAATAGSVHVSRTAARPVANLALLGPVLSLLEDIGALLLVLSALLAPILIPVIAVLVFLTIRYGLKRMRERGPVRSTAS
jgi:hypothetical protein